MAAKILIGCEFSATVRTAFEKKGFNPLSCDIIDTDVPGNHFIGDLQEKLQESWDLIIAFPPCTFLSSAGLHYCNIENHGTNGWERIKERNKAVDFFLSIWFSNAKHICIENPTGFISSSIIKPSQIIHPYYFGDEKMKRTCLWLKNLPTLLHSNTTDLFSQKTHNTTFNPYKSAYKNKHGKEKKTTWIDYASKHERSRFSPYIAEAMADQWADILIQY
ncbi:hypothetical protein [Elizabethkingia meningoseptica]|uniref:hypothetical protein n=1 Tax=Elizabethkingia meningoseptica TaxID=238 RepID=UPI003891464A